MTFFPSLLILGMVILGAVIFGWFGSPAETAAKPYQANNSLKAGATTGDLASFFSPSVLHWSKSVETWSQQYGVDANLIATVMQIESCGDPQAQSYAGAQGLFQVMPFHFDAGENPIDPGTNAHRGLSYLKQSLEAAQGDVRKALAGYNGGIGIIDQPEYYWPEETQRYVDWGYRIYTEAASGQTASGALTEWLTSGGQSLCQRASQKLLLFQSGG